MTLTETITNECTEMTYEEAFAYLREKKVNVDGMATSGNVLAYVAGIGKLSTIRDVAADNSSPLRDVADATIVTLETREGFDFASPSTISLLQTFVTAGILTQEQADTIRAIGVKQIPAFPNLTMKDVVHANKPELVVETTSNIIDSLTANRRHDLVVDVSNIPVITHLVVQVRDKFNGSFTPWKHVTTISKVKDEGIYSARINAEFFKPESEFRTVCEYTVNMSLTATVV